MNMDLAVE